MAIVTSLLGGINGKASNMVFSKSGGVTIMREYNPNVTNPNTQSQINQRARLKLASQLAASLAPVIAMKKDGLVSARNKFMKKNMGIITAADGIAQVSYENIQLTEGNVALPQIVATRTANEAVYVQLASSADASVSRVVYIMYIKNSEGKLQFVDSTVVETAGTNGVFAGSLAYTEGDLVLFAYGIRDLSAAATSAYGNYNVSSGSDIARLVATRTLSSSDYQFTQTRGATMFSADNSIEELEADQVVVYIAANGNGSVSGDGFTNGRKVVTIGDSVTVVATADTGYVFGGWYRTQNGTATLVSSEASYTFTANETYDLTALFGEEGQQVSTVRLSVDLTNDSDPLTATLADMLTITPNDGVVEAGTQVTISQKAGQAWEGMTLEGIYDAADGQILVSSTLPYTTYVNNNMTLYFKF